MTEEITNCPCSEIWVCASEQLRQNRARFLGHCELSLKRRFAKLVDAFRDNGLVTWPYHHALLFIALGTATKADEVLVVNPQRPRLDERHTERAQVWLLPKLYGCSAISIPVY